MVSKRVEYQKLRDQGWTLPQIASKFGVSKQAVFNSLNCTSRLSVNPHRFGNPSNPSPEAVAAGNLYLKLGSVIAVAQHLGIGESAAYFRVRQSGVQRNPRGYRREKSK